MLEMRRNMKHITRPAGLIRPCFWLAPSLMLWFALVGEGQQPAVVLPKAPLLSDADQARILTQIKSYASQLIQKLPDFSCSPSAAKGLRMGSTITADLEVQPPPDQFATDWERVKAEDTYREFVESRERQKRLDISPCFANCFLRIRN